MSRWAEECERGRCGCLAAVVYATFCASKCEDSSDNASALQPVILSQRLKH